MSPLLLLSGLVQLLSEGSSSQRAVVLQLPPQVLQLSALPETQKQRSTSLYSSFLDLPSIIGSVFTSQPES